MEYIAHRGNRKGIRPLFENCPHYVHESLKHCDVEVDVWRRYEKWYLGHDAFSLVYLVDDEFLLMSGLWCHAKNIEALRDMLRLGAHCFWHENDLCTLTSQGWIWDGKTARKGKEIKHITDKQ